MDENPTAATGTGPVDPTHPEAKAGEESALVFRSAPMREVADVVEKVSGTDVPILVTGESGVGKEVVAREIHRASGRPGSFVKVNCAALPPTLLESELFGAEEGAYTDAVGRRHGRFERAAGGTLLLDEVTELSVSSQAALLQVLQEGRFTKVGGDHDMVVDVRIVAATNRNLERAVTDGSFRNDLYYRLNGMPIAVPPLRERLEDLPLLLQLFLRRYSRHYDRPAPSVSRATMATLFFYAWPGNVRELEALAQRAVLLGDADAAAAELELTDDDQRTLAPRERALSALSRGESVELKEVSKATVMEVERRLMQRVLERTGWNRRKAAELLQISYKALLYKIRDSGLEEGSRARSG